MVALNRLTGVRQHFSKVVSLSKSRTEKNFHIFWKLEHKFVVMNWNLNYHQRKYIPRTLANALTVAAIFPGV